MGGECEFVVIWLNDWIGLGMDWWVLLFEMLKVVVLNKGGEGYFWILSIEFCIVNECWCKDGKGMVRLCLGCR